MRVRYQWPSMERVPKLGRKYVCNKFGLMKINILHMLSYTETQGLSPMKRAHIHLAQYDSHVKGVSTTAGS